MIAALCFALARLFFLLLLFSVACLGFGFQMHAQGNTGLALWLFHRCHDVWWVAVADGTAWLFLSGATRRWRLP